jgi:hypothetical protein
MASGHVYRANRPNTWLHRPSLRREVFPCQLGAVHTWHISEVPGERSAFPVLGAKLTSGVLGATAAFDPERSSGSLSCCNSETGFNVYQRTHLRR